MARISLGLAVVVFLSFGRSAFALEQVDTGPPVVEGQEKPLSEVDRARVRDDLHLLAQALGVEKPVSSKPEDSANAKTVAEVSDRALDLLEKGVASVASGVEKAAPQVWRVSVRQQYAKAIGPLVFPFIAMLLGVSLAVWLYRKGKEPMKEDWKVDGVATMFWVVTILLLVTIPPMIFANRLGDSAMYLINPEWYALRDLVYLLLGKDVG